MSLKSRSILSVILTGIWVNACEFFRNEVLLKKYWVDHYQSIGMTFPSASITGGQHAEDIPQARHEV